MLSAVTAERLGLRPRHGRVPPGLEFVIKRARGKFADARFESVLEFADALRPYGTGTRDDAGDGSPTDNMLAAEVVPSTERWGTYEVAGAHGESLAPDTIPDAVASNGSGSSRRFSKPTLGPPSNRPAAIPAALKTSRRRPRRGRTFLIYAVALFLACAGASLSEVSDSQNSSVSLIHSSMADVVILREGASVFVTMNRPLVRNALLLPMIRDIATAVTEAGADPSVRAVVITGAGGHFCAGADLRKTMAEDPDLLDRLDIYMDGYHAVIRAIVRCPKPTVAMMDGCAVGFGADIALACDLRVASTASYLQEKFVKIGLMPDGGGTFWLPRLIGTARALRALYLAEKLDAEAMENLGLLVDKVPPESLRARTLELVAELERGAPLAFAELKRAVYESWGDLEGALRREREGQMRLLRSADMVEGVMAWSQKRDPVFSGK